MSINVLFFTFGWCPWGRKMIVSQHLMHQVAANWQHVFHCHDSTLLPSIRRSMLECSSEFGNSQRCECRFICPEDVFNLGPGSTHLDEACVSLSPAQFRPVLANCLLYSYLDLHKMLGKSKKNMKHIIPHGSLMAMNPIVQSVKNHPLNKSKLTSSNRPDVDIPCIVNWNHPLFWWTCEGQASPEYPPPTSTSYLVSLGKKNNKTVTPPPPIKKNTHTHTSLCDGNHQIAVFAIGIGIHLIYLSPTAILT